MFGNRYEFKQDVTPLLKDRGVNPVLMTIKNPQSNVLVEQVHHIILNMLVTKDLANKLFDYIYQQGEILASIPWEIRAYYHHTIQATPGQVVFGRDVIFNLASVVDWQVINSEKQRQVDIDNVQ